MIQLSMINKIFAELMMKDFNLFCVTHKPIALPIIPNFRLIQVGNKTDNFAELRDNSQENIAEKNPYYSELTAFYYVWKNFPSEQVGFCHYRRYLIPPILNQWVKTNGIKPYGSGFLLSEKCLFEQLKTLQNQYTDSLIQTLENTDIILPHPNPLPVGGFFNQYASVHPIAPFFRLLAVLAEIDNQMGLKAHQFFLHTRQAHWNNLFITRWEIFDHYCQFLFKVLFELEQEIKLPESTYQQRVLAFISERLFNFWLWYHKLKITTIDWGILESSTQEKEPHQWQGK